MMQVLSKLKSISVVGSGFLFVFGIITPLLANDGRANESGAPHNELSAPFVNQDPQPQAQSTEAAENSAAKGESATLEPAAKGEKIEKKIESVAVDSKPMRAYEAFPGVLESNRHHEIKTDFQSWSDLIVEEVIEQGMLVSPGKTLVKFKTETIDKAITEAEFAFKNAEFDVQKAELELKLANETFELDTAEAERAWKEAQDDYQYFLNVRLPNRLEDLAFGRKSAGYSLEYTKDELDQLEKMYLEDEITEESEAIVLKRAQRSVESAERNKARTDTNLAREETFDIPRDKVTREVALRKAEHAYQRTLIALPIAKEKAEIAFAQSQFSLAEKQKKLEELKSDREKMEIKAPANGMVYYGQNVRGKWSSRKLEIDQKVTQSAIIVTLVDANDLMIRAHLEETKLKNLSPKMRGKALVATASNKPLSVTINTIASIPGEDGKYDCEIMIDQLPGGMNLMPGMGCKLSFLIADRDAMMTKKASVFSDDDGVSHYVFVVDGDQAKRVDVVVGNTVGEEIEILEGLNAGDKIAKLRQ